MAAARKDNPGAPGSTTAGQSGAIDVLSVGDPDALRVWATEKFDALGVENYTSTYAGAPYAVLGLSAFWMGDFAAVDEILAKAAESLGEGPWTDDVTARVILQRSLAGVVASLRGRIDEAEQRFVEALDPTGGTAVEEARVIALSMRAALCSEGQPERALEDVSRARQLSSALGAVDLSAIATIGEGWALSELGQLADASHVLAEAVAMLPGDLERSVAQLRLAEVQLRMGDRAGARETIDAARNIFLATEARYWAARAAILTGAIDRDRGGRWLKLARELSLPDPAYERLFLPSGALTVDVAGTPCVRRDAEPVEFLTRHAEVTVQLLALAGDGGVPMQELTTLFWPEVPKDRQRARLRTLLWQVRNSLGADAWRVQRRRDLVVFDTTGVDIVGTRSKAAILRDFSARRTRR